MKRLLATATVTVLLTLTPTVAQGVPQPGPRPCETTTHTPVYQHMTAQDTGWSRTRTKTVVVCRVWKRDGTLWTKTRFRFVVVSAWVPRCTPNPGPRETLPECDPRDA